MVAQLIVTLIILFLSCGYMINYTEIPDLEVTIPISILVFFFHIFVIALGRITDDSS